MLYTWVIVLLVGLVLQYLWTLFSRRRKYLTGPTPLPLVGNLFFFKSLEQKDDANLLRLRTDWGDTTMLWLGQQPVLIVNTAKAATELLSERSTIYSSRPEMNDFRKALWPWRLVSTPAGDTFRFIRKLYHNNLSPMNSLMFRKYQDRESAIAMLELLDEPTTFLQSAQRYTMSVIFSVVYGASMNSLWHPILIELNALWDVVMKYFEPGTLLIDFLPPLDRIPVRYQPTLRKLVALVSREMDLHAAFLDTLKESSKLGKIPDCFGKLLLAQFKNEALDDEQAAHVLAMLIGAGADTTSTVLQTVFKILALHPECLRLAQQELDLAVGQSRLPDFSDEPSLPYIRCLIKEIHRWNPIGSLGIPHCATRDDVYSGRIIPKGTIVFPNLPSISRDPARYTDPDLFDPTRHKEHVDVSAFASATQTNWHVRDHFHYGFGRRLCQGIHVAEPSLFIMISRLIWAFDIRAKEGTSTLSMTKRYHALVWKPEPYEVHIQIRDPHRANIVRTAAEIAEVAKSDTLEFDQVMRNIPQPGVEQRIDTGPRL